ncbi:hypothetical protein [Burkholderia anthina]|uniref:hypothetical protein n=1 Tax=Burkholderia anthina TaxID=179879 RepID=UPI00158DE210|nr:hypothetical protein [Burkholderia anthina]
MKIEAIGRSGRRAKANGASAARAIDTPQTLRIPGADASSRWSRARMQRDRSDGG